MSYRLVAVDMDGTLLDSNNTITPATQEAVRRVAQANKYFCLTTGRPPVAIEHFYRQLGLDTPVISYNGARIIDMSSGAAIYEQLLSAEDALTVIELGVEHGVTMCLWAQDKLYCNEVDEHSLWYRRISEAPMERLEHFADAADFGVTKILWCGDSEHVAAWNALAAERLGSAVSYASSGPHLLEFFDRRVSKGAALERLCGILNVAREETIAIGDGWNDLPMLEYAGLGVAMANAPAALREKCGFVTASNDEDGVRLAIERFVL